jgi:hypothetical protein
MCEQRRIFECPFDDVNGVPSINPPWFLHQVVAIWLLTNGAEPILLATTCISPLVLTGLFYTRAPVSHQTHAYASRSKTIWNISVRVRRMWEALHP